MTSLWNTEKAQQWYARQPWLVGCNFTPSSAANQLEYWQADSFDPLTIDRELGWAAGLGMNTARVFLHDLAWSTDRAGFISRVNQFLSIASRHAIRPLLVFFDDCWNPEPAAGPQPAPLPGVHNSLWWQSPGQAKVNDPQAWPILGEYVQDVITAFAHDERVLAWDLYNEPGNQGQGARSLPFLQQVFAWARAVEFSQPVTCGVWSDQLPDFNRFQLDHSDILSFHHYGPVEELRQFIARLKPLNRPILCTEYMARKAGSLFQTHLPVFKEEKVAAYNWGLVDGKTQTKYPWNSPGGGPEPDPWFHEIFHADGRPYREEETRAIRELTSSR